MSQLHAALGVAVLGTSAMFALVAFGMSALARPLPWLERFRLATAGLAVGAAATGVARALNGHGQSETIHWLYGAVIVAVPVMAAGIDVGESTRVRSAVYGLAGVVMALIAWRLASTG